MKIGIRFIVMKMSYHFHNDFKMTKIMIDIHAWTCTTHHENVYIIGSW